MSPGVDRNSSVARIIVVGLLLFTLGLALVSTYYLHLLKQESVQSIFSQQSSTISLLADRIDRVLSQQLATMEIIGRRLVDEGELLPADQARELLDNQVSLHQIFNGGLLLLDLNAAIVAESSPLREELANKLANSQHIQRLFSRGAPQVGPPLMNIARPNSLLPVSLPLWSPEGLPLGALTGLVDLAVENFIVRESGHNYGHTGGYLVIDPDSGLIIAATEEGRLLQPIPEPGRNRMHDRYMAGYEGSGIAVSSLGVEEISSARQIPSAGWFAVVRLPVEEAMAPLRRLKWRLLGASLVILLVAGTALVWFVLRQLAPLTRYSDILDEMTAGRRPIEPLPQVRRDELGRLLGSFNHLIASLRSAEEKFRGMAETSLDLIFQLTPDGTVSYCSPAAVNIMKRGPEEVVGTHFQTHVSPEDLGKAQRAFASALKGDQIRLWEISLRQAGGSTFIGEVNIGPIRENGRVVGVQGVVRDVTPRRRAAAALAEQLSFQKMVAEISTSFVKSQGVLEIDRVINNALALSGGFFKMDRAYLFTYSADGTTMSNTHEWCAPGVEPQIHRIQDVSISSYPWIIEQVRQNDYVYLPDIGRLPPEAEAERREFEAQEIKSMLLLPLESPGRPLGFIGFDGVRRARVWSDEVITLLKVVAETVAGALARYAMEEELQRKSDELASSNAELLRSNAELTDFAHIASHDLQEPLRKVMAFGDRLHLKYNDVLGEKGEDYLRRMQNAAQRMQGLIDDLLQYARVTTKGRPFEEVDLNLVLQDVQETLERSLEEAQATVEVAELPMVMADGRQMHSLFQNLLSNAIKYRKPQLPPLIKVSGKEEGDGFVAVRVSDNGIGFDEKYLDRIFRPFQRLHGRGEYHGSGIGLAICNKIVQRHGGNLWAVSREGEGAEFVVRLPRA